MKKYAVIEFYITGYKEFIKFFTNKSSAIKYAENKNKKISKILKSLGKAFKVKELNASQKKLINSNRNITNEQFNKVFK